MATEGEEWRREGNTWKWKRRVVWEKEGGKTRKKNKMSPVGKFPP